MVNDITVFNADRVGLFNGLPMLYANALAYDTEIFKSNSELLYEAFQYKYPGNYKLRPCPHDTTLCRTVVFDSSEDEMWFKLQYG